MSTALVLLSCSRSEASSYCPGCEAGIIGAGAALAGGITATIYFVHHSHTSVVGCVLQSDSRLSLKAKNGETYELMNAPAELKANRRVQLRGHKSKTSLGRVFSVDHISHDYGDCR